MDVFTTLMTYRSGWSMENTKAMNVINVVFADDKARIVLGGRETYA